MGVGGFGGRWQRGHDIGYLGSVVDGDIYKKGVCWGIGQLEIGI